jgi:hypothetical protein
LKGPWRDPRMQRGWYRIDYGNFYRLLDLKTVAMDHLHNRGIGSNNSTSY